MSNILSYSYKVTSNLSKRSLRALMYSLSEVIEKFLRNVILFSKNDKLYNKTASDFYRSFERNYENPFFVPYTKEHKNFISLIKGFDFFEFFVSRKKNKIFIQFHASDPFGSDKGFSFCWEYELVRTNNGICLRFVKNHS